MGDGSPMIFLTRPISGTIIALAVLYGIVQLWLSWRRARTIAEAV
jgi:TctA family transporter